MHYTTKSVFTVFFTQLHDQILLTILPQIRDHNRTTINSGTKSNVTQHDEDFVQRALKRYISVFIILYEFAESDCKSV